MKTILHLCADIGSDTQIYKENGYNVKLIGKDIGVENYNPPKNVYGIIANPVCTNFSIANNPKNRNYDEGMSIVNHCIRIIFEANPNFWVIENPATGRLKKYLGEPDFTYEPWNFGSPWTKRTALWGKFNKPKATYKKWEDVPKNNKLYIRPGRPKPGFAFLHKSAIYNIAEFKPFIGKVKNDMDFRSLCSQKFAKEFYKVNM